MFDGEEGGHKGHRAVRRSSFTCGAEGFHVGDDAPPIQGIDGGREGRLSAVRNAIAYFFEKGAL